MNTADSLIMTGAGAGSSGSALTNKSSATKNIRFWVLVSGLMFFFGCHNYLQELIMSLPGFRVSLLQSLRQLKVLLSPNL